MRSALAVQQPGSGAEFRGYRSSLNHSCTADRGDDLERAYFERWVERLQVGEQWEAAGRLARGLA